MNIELNIFWGMILGLTISLILTKKLMDLANFIGNMVRLCITKIANLNKSNN